ncbi:MULTISPECIES: hypothetical protein [Pseudomonadati]|uniref:Uncharacterized protein n=1 Tax=Shewanella aestuarii TaxID=1028752 RepID=A0ABT0L6P2_9GAMM|nr:hypothetical protein [Shewanella aestuarii]MCL1118861.1 hypothetical protein [Shewanella aestuarii]GGN83906.1 hypothetical protein GCM10009193_32510 [Shewanella aestuarii]
MNSHKITISGQNINIDEYITPDFARKIISLIYSDETAILPPPEEGVAVSVVAPQEKKVLKESKFKVFCEEHDVRRYCEVALAVGVYLAKQGQELFTVKDYRALFEELKNAKATNAPSNIAWAIKNNWIKDVGNKTYKVRPAGRKVLKEKFPDSVRGSTRGDPKK